VWRAEAGLASVFGEGSGSGQRARDVLKQHLAGRRRLLTVKKKGPPFQRWCAAERVPVDAAAAAGTAAQCLRQPANCTNLQAARAQLQRMASIQLLRERAKCLVVRWHGARLGAVWLKGRAHC
jgi:hypothetical protein